MALYCDKSCVVFPQDDVFGFVDIARDADDDSRQDFFEDDARRTNDRKRLLDVFIGDEEIHEIRVNSALREFWHVDRADADVIVFEPLGRIDGLGDCWRTE